MKWLTSGFIGTALLASSFATDLHAGNKFGLPDFEKMMPKVETRNSFEDFIKIDYRTKKDNKPILYRTFVENGIERWFVTTVDCEINGEIGRYDVFIRDVKIKKVIQRQDYNLFKNLVEVPYDTMIDMTKVLCPAGELI